MGCLNSTNKRKERDANSSGQDGFSNLDGQERTEEHVSTNDVDFGESSKKHLEQRNIPQDEQGPKNKNNGENKKKENDKETKNGTNVKTKETKKLKKSEIEKNAETESREQKLVDLIKEKGEAVDEKDVQIKVIQKDIVRANEGIQDDLRTENGQLRERFETSERENITQIESLEKKLVDLKKEKDEVVAEKEAQIKALQKEKDDIARENVKLQEDNLRTVNEEVLEKFEKSEKEKKPEIEIHERKLADSVKEKDKVEKKAKTQALQEEKDNFARATTGVNTEQNDKEKQQLKEQLQQKDNEIKQLKEKNKELDEELKETHDRCDKITFGKREKKDSVKSLELKLKTLNSEKEKMQEEFIKIEMEKKAEIKILEKRLSDLKKQRDLTVAKMRSEKQVLQKEKDDLLLRLSEMTGRRLTDNNPNIADLSDENRPTKLAERYAELYDNEWTDAFSYLQTFDAFKESEKLVINTLVTIVVEAFTLSTKTAQGKLENLRDALSDFYGNTSSKDGQVKDIMKQLKDQMKKVTKPSENLMKEYMDVMLKRLTSLSITALASSTFKPYLQKCLEISWLMAVQDPPLYLTVENCQKGQTFNRNIFKEYTKSGPFIDFVVWPAVFLEKGGPLLCKGVVQCKKSNSFRSSKINVLPQKGDRKAKSLYIKHTSTPLSSTLSTDEEEKKTSSMVLTIDDTTKL